MVSEFKDFVNENVDLADEVKKEFFKVFPNGWINVKSGFLGDDVTKYLSFGLVDPKELTGNYGINDPVYHTFEIGGGNLERMSGNIMLNPSKGSHLAMDIHKVSFRKVKGDDKKLLAGFSRYLKKLKTEVKKVESDIYNRAKYSDKFFK